MPPATDGTRPPAGDRDSGRGRGANRSEVIAGTEANRSEVIAGTEANHAKVIAGTEANHAKVIAGTEANRTEVIARRRQAALAGHVGDEAAARQALADEAPPVRATALGALARMGQLNFVDLVDALKDGHPEVRVRAAELTATFGQPGAGLAGRATADANPQVVEAACFALGEIGEVAANGERAVPALSEGEVAASPALSGGDVVADPVAALSDVARGHSDPLCREAAVAALGAIGDRRGLPAILDATADKPAVRRRAVLALAPFDGPEVEAALERASEDRDWQVRQAAEDLSDRTP